LWPDEIRKNKVIWPLRFEFDVEFCLPEDEWETKKLASKAILPRAGFQPLSEALGKELISAMVGTEYVIPEYKFSLVSEKTEKPERIFYTFLETQ
jgi:hypothetical protein